LFLLAVCFSAYCFVSGDEVDEFVKEEDIDKYELAPPYYGATLKVPSYILPVLKWSLGLLEPFIDRETVNAHYLGHHNAYRMKMNKALADWRQEFPDSSFAQESVITMLRDLPSIPQQYYTSIVNNGGGYVNHAIYWSNLSPNLETNATAREPTGALREEIEQVFGSYQAFREKFTEQALSKFGSGYVWLVRNPLMERVQLSIVATDNQESPLSVGEFPLLVIDVWEHAYYLKHQFRRPNYVEDWWMVVDWENVAELDEFWKNDMKLRKKYFRKPTEKVEEEEKKEEL